MNVPKLVNMGKIGQPHGLKGWLVVHTSSDLKAYSSWFIQSPLGWQPLTIVDTRLLNHKTIIQLQGVNDIEAAQPYSGKTIAVPRDQLPALPDNQYYWTDLEGSQVINLKHQSLGQVDYLFQAGLQIILVVKKEHRRYLIPFQVPQIVKEVDLKQQQITLDWDVDF
jgi:16S rRNA processing protein RimM